MLKEENVIERSSDDGEPSGTASAPMLNILKQKNICNVLVIVTRYFGGILLGTGGLVRAYSQATENVIENSNLINKTKGIEVEIVLEYKDLEKMKYFCRMNSLNIIDIKYNEDVTLKIEIKEEDRNIFENKEKLNFNIKKYMVIKERYI